MSEYLFFLALPIIAFLYSAVGHGGASGYLALMSLCSFAADDLKAIALTLNLFVAGIAFIQYYTAGYFDKKLFLVLSCASIPMAFIGGRIQLDTNIYFSVLAIFLFLAGAKLMFSKEAKSVFILKPYSSPRVLILGGCIGFVSGLLGLGGGIILSPLVLLFGWSKSKTTAGVSALFIFVNSAAGLLGQFSIGFRYPASMPIIISLVVIGAMLGSYLGSQKWSPIRIKQLLATVLLLASFKIFWS